MFRKPYKVLFFSMSLFYVSRTQAQNIDRPFENIPYTKYGLGEEQNSINPALRAMGSATAAFSDPYVLNTDNPASYADIRNMTYDAGIEGRFRTLRSNSSSYQTGTAGLSYFTLGIPMGKYAGAVVGFKPYTKTGYTLTDTSNTLIGSTAYLFNGKGGTNYFYIGGAGKYKGFSLGANIGYIFGNITHTSWLQTTNTVNSINNSEFRFTNNIGGFYSQLGLQYEKLIYKDYLLRAGIQYNLQQNINSTYNEYWISHPFYASDTSGSDTAYAAENAKSKIALPSSFHVGVQIAQGDKWLVGISYKQSNWNEYNYRSVRDSIGSKAYRLSIGAAFTPNSLSLYNYWSRVTYRIGFYTGQDYVQINGKQANYFAGTFGLSLPFKRSTDRIHTAMEIGSMEGLGTNGLKQNFIRFTLGVSLNDRTWFVKRKYD